MSADPDVRNAGSHKIKIESQEITRSLKVGLVLPHSLTNSLKLCFLSVCQQKTNKSNHQSLEISIISLQLPA